MPGNDSLDEAAHALYDLDPGALEPGTKVQRLPNRGPKLGGAVPVRFPAATIDAIKKLADERHITVSAWIRREIEESLDRHAALTLRPNIVPFKPRAVQEQIARDTRRLAVAAGS